VRKLSEPQTYHIAFFSILVGLASITTNAQSAPISISYDHVYQDVKKLQSVLKDFNLLTVEVKFYSGLCGADPNDINLYIQTKSGKELPVPLDRYGFAKIPLSKNIYGSRALIVSNQASDFKYQIKIGIILPTNSNITYTRLTDIMQQATSAIKRSSSLPSFLMPNVAGLILIYNKPGSSVVVKIPDKNLIFSSQPANGFIGLPENSWIIKFYQDKALKNLNPIVELQNLPDKIEPLFDPDIEAAVNKKINENNLNCKQNSAQ